MSRTDRFEIYYDQAAQEAADLAYEHWKQNIDADCVGDPPRFEEDTDSVARRRVYEDICETFGLEPKP